MKKIIALALAAVLACGMLAGCSSGSPSVSSFTSSSSPAASNSASLPYAENIPEFLIEYYEGYQKLTQENEFAFELLDGGPRPSETSPECFCIYFNAKGELEDREQWISRNPNMWFYGNENGVNRGFSVYFDTADDLFYVKDFITATFMYFGGLDFSIASEKMQSLINTYSGKDFSEVAQIGNYYFFIVPDSSDADFCGVSDSELWSDYSESSVYTPINYELYEAPVMNKGTKVLVHGTIVDCGRENFTDKTTSYYIILNADDGHSYKITYSFIFTPLTFEVGEEITVYGRIAMSLNKDSLIAAELIE